MTMSSRAIATASEAHVAEAASALLTRGNAVDAVVAGVFAAAAASPSVLLGPVQVLLGGAGLGLRAFDGRTQQPGRGAPRPRGFTSDDVIPGAARVGVPALPAALAAALATSGGSTLAQAMAPAIAIASAGRKPVLQRISQRGPAALTDDRIASELVAAGGRLAGGVLTKEDLDALRPPVMACDLYACAGGRRAAVVPWRALAITGEAPAIDASRTRIVAVADAKGLLAIACYEVHEDGAPSPSSISSRR
jgi:gamma-glutamyltranspeptidase